MAKDKLEFARIASAEEVAAYLASLSTSLSRGDVTLESGMQTLHLTPSGDVKIELRVREREDKAKIEIEIAWKRRLAAKAADLRVGAGHAPATAHRH